MPRTSEHLRAGELDRRMTLQSPVFNAAGDEIASWRDEYTTWAALEPISERSREMVEASRDISEQFTLMKMRYRKPVPTTTWRAVDLRSNLAYDVRGVDDMFSQRRALYLTLRLIQ